MIKENYTLSDILSINPSLGFVLFRFGINLDSEERVLKDACEAFDIDSEFFVDVLNLYHDPSSFDPYKMKEYPLEVIIDYLKRTHKFYLTKRLVEIELSIKNLIKNFEDQPNILSYLNLFFLKYRSSLVDHIKEEEGVLFPYIKLLLNHPLDAYEHYDMLTSPLQFFVHNHDDRIERELSELRVFLIKKAPDLMNGTQYRIFLTQLETFEKDLNIHALVEDELLIPMAINLEKTIFERQSA